MAKLSIKSIFLCEYFSFDMNKKPSIIGIFERINLDKFPAKFLKMNIVIFAKISSLKPNEELKLQSKMLGPDGKVCSQKLPPLNIRPEPNKENMSIVMEIGNFLFEKEGKHTFELLYDNKVIGKKSFSVGTKLMN